MRLPQYLIEKDPLLNNVPLLDTAMDNSEITEYEWTEEELENAERQVEEVLMEEAYLEECLEEMLEEEEAQWFYYSSYSTSVQMDEYMPTSLPANYLWYGSSLTDMYQYITIVPPFEVTTFVPVIQSLDTPLSYSAQWTNPEQKHFIHIANSKLNPEAPEFVPQSLAS